MNFAIGKTYDFERRLLMAMFKEFRRFGRVAKHVLMKVSNICMNEVLACRGDLYNVWVSVETLSKTGTEPGKVCYLEQESG